MSDELPGSRGCIAGLTWRVLFPYLDPTLRLLVSCPGSGVPTRAEGPAMPTRHPKPAQHWNCRLVSLAPCHALHFPSCRTPHARSFPLVLPTASCAPPAPLSTQGTTGTSPGSKAARGTEGHSSRDPPADWGQPWPGAYVGDLWQIHWWFHHRGLSARVGVKPSPSHGMLVQGLQSWGVSRTMTLEPLPAAQCVSLSPDEAHFPLTNHVSLAVVLSKL